MGIKVKTVELETCVNLNFYKGMNFNQHENRTHDVWTGMMWESNPLLWAHVTGVGSM